MGKLTAIEIANSGLPLESQLAWHLQSNHYPPVPIEMVTACISAIEAVNDGEPTRTISLPIVSGFQILWRGLPEAPAFAIIDGHHLHDFLDDLDTDGEE